MNLAEYITPKLLSFEAFIHHVQTELEEVQIAREHNYLKQTHLNSRYLFHERKIRNATHVFLRQRAYSPEHGRDTIDMVLLSEYPISLFGQESYDLLCEKLLISQQAISHPKTVLAFHKDDSRLFYEYLYAIYRYNQELFFHD